MEYILFFIGLGFFLYIIFIVERAEEKRYDRKLNERREFGYEAQKRRSLQDLKNL
jgi:hypothetical protein